MGVNNPGQTDDGDDNKGGYGNQRPGTKPEPPQTSPNKPGQGFPKPGAPNTGKP